MLKPQERLQLFSLSCWDQSHRLCHAMDCPCFERVVCPFPFGSQEFSRCGISDYRFVPGFGLDVFNLPTPKNPDFPADIRR